MFSKRLPWGALPFVAVPQNGYRIRSVETPLSYGPLHNTGKNVSGFGIAFSGRAP